MPKILSIDGGGVRGIFPLTILKSIQNDFKEIDFCRDFDVISGTSTGSIIAAGIAFNIELDLLIGLYKIIGKYIY